MYKRLNFEDLTSINTNFFKNLHYLMGSKKHTFFKGFLRETMQESNQIYFFKSWRPLFRVQIISQDPLEYRLVDEQDRIELFTGEAGINQIHNLLKNTRQVSKIASENKTIMEQLFEKLEEGDLQFIKEKPFVVYDIETTYTGERLSDQHFEMAYSVSTDDLSEWLKYQYIDRDNMHRYCDYLLEYPGRIVGYNQIWFDNPVMIQNVWYGQDELDILNKKSIDPFLILHKLLRKRLKLSKVAEALVSMWKTLDSGAEWSNLLEEYKKTEDKKLLRKVKKYCKNDVRITLWVFLYLLDNLKIHIEWDTKEFTIDEMIKLWSDKKSLEQAENESIDTWFNFS